ncbi:feronia receptor-like kinase, partial [Trifolium medium]|nr:feronia receptor-like kinase [Trifolium medium]
MPSFLYYTDLNDLNYHLKSLDFDNAEFQIRSDKALEIVYRINVGENQVPPSKDT